MRLPWISCGYALVFSVTVVVISTGFIIADYYTQPAKETVHALTQKPELLQKEYSYFLRSSTELNQVLFEVKSYVKRENYKHRIHAEGVPRFLVTYEGVPEAYIWQVKELLKPITLPKQKPKDVELVEKLLFNFTNESLAIKFEDMGKALTEVIDASDRDYHRANAALITAKAVRLQIVVGSILLSSVTAILLAIYSRLQVTSGSCH